MPTIAHNGNTFTPILVITYEWSQQVNNIIKPILNRSDVDVSFQPAGLREGELVVLCANATDAATVAAMHADLGTCQLTDPDQPTANMTYVPTKRINVKLDPETLTRWLVTTGFQEIPA